MSDQTLDVIIIGAGAAGLMCALSAAHHAAKVLVLEHQSKAGAKILISGGGRCNFTNLDISHTNFISQNSHFCRSALSRYTQHDFIAMVKRHKIGFHEKKLGQLFCDGSAAQILKMLLCECAAKGVDLRLNQKINDITRSGNFRVETDTGNYFASRLVLASGGLSIPKLGATGFAYQTAKRFGLKLVTPRPGLVPLIASPQKLGISHPMMGVSLRATAAIQKQHFDEKILFTHKGLSGPAVLQISSYWKQGDTVTLDLAPKIDVEKLLIERKRTRAKSEPATVLGEVLPARLAKELAATLLPYETMANIPDRELLKAAMRLKHWPVSPQQTEGWAKAEVTVGGINTNELSSRTMEAKNIPGLYAIGEAVDVTGWLGGYNFQWAWSSGWCAGQAIAAQK